MMNLAVGAVAGVINVLMTTPLWGVMTVLTTQRTRGVKGGVVPYRGMLDGLIRLGKEEGVSGLWKGCLLYTSPSPRDATLSRMPSSA